LSCFVGFCRVLSGVLRRAEPTDPDRRRSCGLTDKLYRFFTVRRGNFCKWLIGVLKLYRFLVMPDQTRMDKGFRDNHGGHWSGKGAALPPLPPLRTGRETFASSGSSRNKAPRERSRLHDGLIPACWRVMPTFFWNARSAKYGCHCGSNGLASFRILT